MEAYKSYPTTVLDKISKLTEEIAFNQVEYQEDQLKMANAALIRSKHNAEQIIDLLIRDYPLSKKEEQEEPKELKDICPWCQKEDFVRSVVYLNAEIYGSKHYNVCCQHCNKPVRVYISRDVHLYNIDKADFKTDDWGQVAS
jgi:hypothetical protein